MEKKPVVDLYYKERQSIVAPWWLIVWCSSFSFFYYSAMVRFDIRVMENFQLLYFALQAILLLRFVTFKFEYFYEGVRFDASTEGFFLSELALSYALLAATSYLYLAMPIHLFGVATKAEVNLGEFVIIAASISFYLFSMSAFRTFRKPPVRLFWGLV